MIRSKILALLFLPCASVYAQQTDFDVLKGQDTSLPLVNLTFDENELSSDDYIEGTIDIVDKQMRTEAGEVSVHYDADFRIRGGSITNLDKKSFAVKLFKYNNKGKKKDLDKSIFGIREENSWILDAMGYDKMRMRNRVCFDLWNEMSSIPYETEILNDNNPEKRNGTKGEFVEVFINGTYHGLYCMTDKIDRKLLGLEKYDDDNSVFQGLIYQGKEKKSSGSHLDSFDGNAWELEYPDDYSADPEAWQPLKALIDFCGENTTDEAFLANYNDYFYTSNLVDYMVMTMALNVIDNLYKNTFLSVPNIVGGHCYLLTPWDMDGSLGRLQKGVLNDVFSVVTRYNEIPPYDRLYKDNMDGFVDEVKKKWLELQTTTFSIKHVHDVLDAYGTMFVSSGAWQREYNKWGGSVDVPLAENLSDELNYVKGWYERNFANLCDIWGWRGDVNGDNKVDMNDVNLLCDIILEKTTEYTFYKADVNQDGFINAADIVETINLMPESE